MKTFAIRLCAGLAGLALLAGAMWLEKVEPEALAGSDEQIRSKGRVGEEISNRMFAARVEQVTVARSIVPARSTLSSAGSRELRTDGVFVVVTLKAKSWKEPLSMADPKLETPGGYSFTAGARSAIRDTNLLTLQPLLWTDATYTFELPEERLAGARLVMAQGGLVTMLSAACEVDLGFSEAKADEAIASARTGVPAGEE